MKKVNRHEEAIESYDKAIMLHSTDPWLYIEKGECLASLGRFLESVDCTQEALRIEPLNRMQLIM